MASETIHIGQLSNQKKYVETATTGIVAELVATWAQPSTEAMGILGGSTSVIGHVIGDASTAVIGHVIADASTAKIGALQASTEIIGYVKIDQTTPGTSNAVVLATTGAEFWQNNQAVTLLASTSRTATTNSADQTNYNGRGLILQVVSDTSTGASLTPTLQIKDSISGGYFTAWTAAAALSSTGHRAYLFDLGGVGGAGSFTEAVNMRLTRTWRFSMTHSSSGATQYSVSGENLL
ncbi:MAG: hypothetical protein Q7K03_08365 [Dehalococcoidia bacterium]|nr:hypothetical protein [Dehalococcoidia bacterium]